MSFGAHWGLGWGHFTGAYGQFTVAAARAIASNIVRVVFTQEPIILSSIGANDAANLANWTLVRDSNGRALTILAASAVSGGPLAVDITIAGAFVRSTTSYTVTAANLESNALSVLVAPKSATFFGMGVQNARDDLSKPLLDIQNTQVSETAVNGTLSVGSSGDYVLESGLTLVKKLIFRRLTTAQGEFYHLAGTDYGLGLKSKEWYTPGNLIILQSRIEAQVRQETEVEDAQATVVLRENGVLLIRLQVKLLQTDQPFQLSFPVTAA